AVSCQDAASASRPVPVYGLVVTPGARVNHRQAVANVVSQLALIQVALIRVEDERPRAIDCLRKHQRRPEPIARSIPGPTWPGPTWPGPTGLGVRHDRDVTSVERQAFLEDGFGRGLDHQGFQQWMEQEGSRVCLLERVAYIETPATCRCAFWRAQADCLATSLTDARDHATQPLRVAVPEDRDER